MRDISSKTLKIFKNSTRKKWNHYLLMVYRVIVTAYDINYYSERLIMPEIVNNRILFFFKFSEVIIA